VQLKPTAVRGKWFEVNNLNPLATEAPNMKMTAIEILKLTESLYTKGLHGGICRPVIDNNL
jgi:hypothetical protein